MDKSRPRSGSELKRVAPKAALKSPAAQKDLPKGKLELALPAGDELDLPAPKKTKRLAAPRQKKSWSNFLRGTKHYTFEYAITCWLLISLLIVTYWSAFYLADRWSTVGNPPSRNSTIMLASVIYGSIGLLLLLIMLKRTLAQEAKQPKIINKTWRHRIFEFTLRFAILGTIGFGLATIYLIVSSPFQSGRWSNSGIYAAATAVLTGLHACLVYALPRLPDEENTRSLIELAVAVPCVLIMILAFSLNFKPAQVIDTDRQSLKDLLSLNQYISNQYQANHELPKKFKDIISTQSIEIQNRAKLHNYNYLPLSTFAERILGQRTIGLSPTQQSSVFYSLCANFNKATPLSDSVPKQDAISEQIIYQKTHPLSVNSEHPAGNYCILVVQ